MGEVGPDAVARAVCPALDGRHAVDVASHRGEGSVLHVAGRSGLAGDYQGRDPILGLLACMADLSGGTLSYGTPETVSEARGQLVMAGRIRPARGRRSLDTEALLTIDVDTSMLLEAWLRNPEQAVFDRFWS